MSSRKVSKVIPSSIIVPSFCCLPVCLSSLLILFRELSTSKFHWDVSDWWYRYLGTVGGNKLFHYFHRLRYSSQQIQISPCVEDEDAHQELIHSHLNTMLTSARRCPNVTHLELLEFLFPNVQLDQRDAFLLNLVFRHYRSEVSFTLQLVPTVWIDSRHNNFSD